MATVPVSTDNVSTSHDRIQSLTTELVIEIPNQYRNLTSAQRRAVDAACAGFGQDLVAAGIRLQREQEVAL